MRDRRVVRTRQMLRDALFALIEEQGYDALSIQDIAERANVGRATFYVHFQDKEQLLLASVRELLSDMEEHMPAASAVDMLDKKQTLSVFVFRHVKEHEHIYRALLDERGAAIVMVHLRSDVAGHLGTVIAGLLAQAQMPLPEDLLANYCASSLWALVRWWLKSDFPRTAEEMGQLYWRLINLGLIETLGIADVNL